MLINVNHKEKHVQRIFVKKTSLKNRPKHPHLYFGKRADEAAGPLELDFRYISLRFELDK